MRPDPRGAWWLRLAALAALLLAALAAADDLSDEDEPARPSATGPPPEAVLAELPFLALGSPGEVYVDLAPPGSERRLPLQLDTGANVSVLTPGLARSLGVMPRSLKRDSYRRATRLGRDLHFFVDTAQGELSAPGGMEYGLLGGEFLRNFVLEVDYPARRVRFLDPELYRVPESAPDPDETVLPVALVGSRPLVRLQVAARAGTKPRTVKMLLDTGASYGLMLGGHVAKRLGLASRPVPGLRLRGIRGEIAIELGEAARVGLGDFALKEQPVIVAPRGIYQQGFSGDSVLGWDLLGRFRVRLDYPRRRLWLRRDPTAATRLLGEDYRRVRRSGVVLAQWEGRVWVLAVLPDGAGQRLGLEPEDVLADVDPTDEGFDVEALHVRLGSGAPIRVLRAVAGGDPVVVELPDGESTRPPPLVPPSPPFD